MKNLKFILFVYLGVILLSYMFTFRMNQIKNIENNKDSSIVFKLK